MTTYRFKTKPYSHQKEAIRKLIDTGGKAALLMEPRTGKTKTVIDYLSMLSIKGRIDRAVVICPPRVMDVWVDEFHTHCPINYHLIVWDKDSRSGRANGRKIATPPPAVRSAHDLTVLIVNYNAFATPGRRLPSGRRSKASGRFKVRQQIQRWIGSNPAAGILDESHKIKSPSGRAATMIVSMRDYFSYRILMTGTPVTKEKRIFDIWMQWLFLNPERFADFEDLSDFKNYYGKWTNRNGFPQFLRSRNVDDLRERIHKDSYAITRAECYDLPKRTVIKKMIPLSTSGPVYDELAEEMIAQFEREGRTHKTEATIPLTMTLRLSQITGGFAKTTEGELIQVGSEKMNIITQLLEDAQENDEKLVIGARFRAHLDSVIAIADQFGIPSYPVRGGLSRDEVTRNIKSFRRRDGVAICPMNPAAGGLGIDLSCAAHMVWYSLTPSWVDYTQANDRIALSPEPTTFTYLLAKNTVDTILYDTLKADGNLAKTITDNPRRLLRK